jgi:single-stranded-DNA-specific exonuclease
VIGIVAGQLAERFNRPVVLLASPPDEMARGSARSVEGVNINLAIAAHSQLLGSFGGHPMAAGLSISSERIPEFRRCLSRTVEKMLGEVAREASLQIDAYLPLAEMTPNLAADLERLAPFGAGNPPLVLASRGLVIVSETSLGRSGEHRLVRVEDEVGAAYRVVWWQGAGWPLPEGRFDLAYAARISTYRGAGEVQIEWLDARETEERSVEAAVQRPPIEVVDLRGAAHPLPVLQRLAAEGVQVWREAEAVGKVDGHDRYALQPSDALAIWTPPPGPAELRRALEEVVPRKVYLFCVYPQAGGVDAFLQRLSGLLKFALNQNQGRTRISTLATATGQREAAVQLGLDCLRQGGFIRQEETRGQEIQVARGASPSRMPPEQLAALKAVLEETAAFRAYYQRADKEALVANNS